MGEEYTPGAGARTLRWVPGMLGRHSDGSPARCIASAPRCPYPLSFAFSDDTGRKRGDGHDLFEVGGWEQDHEDPDLVPDLTDRATFWLALDQLAERGWGLSPDSPWRFAWVKHSDCPEALDRALWETRDHEGEETMENELTLPGTIPGLLRRGSPVDVTPPGHDIAPFRAVVGEMLDRAASLWMPERVWEQLQERDEDATAEEQSVWHVDWLALDLTDATGRAHAAWWVAERILQIGGGSAVGWSWSPFGGWKLYGEGDCRTFSHDERIADGPLCVVPKLADAHFADDAEALRLVVLHLAGVTP